MPKKVIIYCDGGSRGNPGPSATGIVIKDEKGNVLEAYGEFLGKQTNNFAEYSAVISGFKKAHALGANEVVCYVDSMLVERQLNKQWKVKHPSMQKLFVQSWNAMQEFNKVTIKHTMREGNKEADAEVNKVLDKHM
ncbi:MAG: ribonuclease HI family protein [Candidatus Magasanikbacteria bacterium]